MSLPWLTSPVELHSSRDPGMCMLTPEQCAYKSTHWRNWYKADWHFALPTVAFILSCIVLLAIMHALSLFAPRSWRASTTSRRIESIARWASYRRWRIGGWSSQSVGTYMLVAVGFVFFMSMTLAPLPYYWPNTDNVHYGNSPPLATRAGWMALACLPFVLILSTKANPIATLVGTSPEKLIVWHNWLAWAMFALALVHTFPFVVYNIQVGGISTTFRTGGLWVTGTIALIAQAYLTIFSVRWIRERVYEFFKATHFFAALVFVIFFFLHCDHILSSWDYFIAAGSLYALSWLYSQCRIYVEHGFKRATLTMVSPTMLRIDIKTKSMWRPGQHVYLRFLTQGFHAISSHPFSICSTTELQEGETEPVMSFYARPRAGLTGRLAQIARKSPGASVIVLLDGPYGGVGYKWFEHSDHTLLFGGGAGAGFTLGLAKDYLSRQLLRESSSSQSSRLTLVVSSREHELRDWFLQELETFVATLERKDTKMDVASCLTVSVHETGPSASPRPALLGEKDSLSVDSQKPLRPERIPVKIVTGRADVRDLSRRAANEQGASVAMIVCGPGSMISDVSSVAASAQSDIIRGKLVAASVWLHTESFTS